MFSRFYNLTPTWWKQAISRHFYKEQVQSITCCRVPKAYNKREGLRKLNCEEVYWDVKFMENERKKIYSKQRKRLEQQQKPYKPPQIPCLFLCVFPLEMHRSIERKSDCFQFGQSLFRTCTQVTKPCQCCSAVREWICNFIQFICCFCFVQISFM